MAIIQLLLIRNPPEHAIGPDHNMRKPHPYYKFPSRSILMEAKDITSLKSHNIPQQTPGWVIFQKLKHYEVIYAPTNSKNIARIYGSLHKLSQLTGSSNHDWNEVPILTTLIKKPRNGILNWPTIESRLHDLIKWQENTEMTNSSLHGLGQPSDSKKSQ